MDRRTLLKNLAISIPGTILIPSFLHSCKKNDIAIGNTDWSGSVIIIGAGASGLYAAHMLKQHAKNADIKILEASSTYGGRIKSLSGFADFDIELGAEEVHGEKSSWYDTVKNAGGNLVKNTTNTDYIVLDGNLKDEGTANTDTQWVFAKTFTEQTVNYSGAEKTVQAYADAQGVATRVQHYANALVGNEYGTCMSRLSANGITAENNLWTSGNGNYELTNKSYKSVLQSAFSDAVNLIQYNIQIKSIDYSAAKVQLTDQAGNIHSADKVIITVPLAILKAGDIRFTPALPAVKTNAISNIGMGYGMKIILKFSSRFWAADLGSLYAANQVPEYWCPSEGKGSDHVLTAFIMGEKAEYLSGLGAGAIPVVLADLDNIYGSGVASAALVDSHIQDWSKEPFIKGAYSYATAGDVIAQRQALAAALDKKIYFAGEASHTAGHNSTVHGAVETGARAASEIVSDVS